ncbi:MAG: GNAT family N-acetyltransferase, partial [Bacteroidota bacterium]
MTVRRATRDDLEALAALWNAFMHEQARLEPRLRVAADAQARWTNDAQHWLADETTRLFVAADPGSSPLAGYVMAHRWAPPPIFESGGEVFLQELFVRPEERSRGVGQRLVESVRTWAVSLGAERVRLEALAANEAGRAFWAQLHATPISVGLAIELPQTTPALPPPRRIGF